MVILGDRLAELRKDKGWKQEQLAKELSISVHTVMSYEQNKSNPDDDMKVKIARLFNISTDYLLGLTDLEISLNRKDVIELPKNFPLEAISEVQEYMKLMILKYNNKK